MAFHAKTPPSFPSSEQSLIAQSAQRIITLLEQGRAKTALSRSSFFTQALLVWDATLREADMNEFLNVACVGMEKAMSEITLAFEELFIQAINNYYDILGATFMLAHLAWKDVGDEYTPWDLVQLVILLTMSDFKPPQLGDPPITICDPCCGSGAFLLGALDYIDTHYPEVIDRGQVKLYGQELTHVGWLMCRVNLRLHQFTRCLRRPWTHRQQATEPAIVREGKIEVQENSLSPALVQQKELWMSADLTIDEGLQQKPLTPYHLVRPMRSRKFTSKRQAPHGLDPLFAQAEELFPSDTKSDARHNEGTTKA